MSGRRRDARGPRRRKLFGLTGAPTGGRPHPAAALARGGTAPRACAAGARARLSLCMRPAALGIGPTHLPRFCRRLAPPSPPPHRSDRPAAQMLDGADVINLSLGSDNALDYSIQDAEEEVRSSARMHARARHDLGGAGRGRGGWGPLERTPAGQCAMRARAARAPSQVQGRSVCVYVQAPPSHPRPPAAWPRAPTAALQAGPADGPLGRQHIPAAVAPTPRCLSWKRALCDAGVQERRGCWRHDRHVRRQ